MTIAATIVTMAVSAFLGLAVGLSAGARFEARLWREKAATGLRMASAGRLFSVVEDES
jgi:hypothetical protein